MLLAVSHKSQTAVSRRLTAACDTKVRYKSASDAAAREAPPWFTPVWRLAVRHINRRRNGKTGLLTSGRAGTYKSSASGLILTALSAGARDSLAGWRVREARAELRESLGCCWPVRPARKSWAAVNLKGRAPIWRLSFFFFFFNNPFKSEPQLRGNGDRAPFAPCTPAGTPSFWTLKSQPSYCRLLIGICLAFSFPLWYYEEAMALPLASPWNCRMKTKTKDRK